MRVWFGRGSQTQRLSSVWLPRSNCPPHRRSGTAHAHGRAAVGAASSLAERAHSIPRIVLPSCPAASLCECVCSRHLLVSNLCTCGPPQPPRPSIGDCPAPQSRQRRRPPTGKEAPPRRSRPAGTAPRPSPPRRPSAPCHCRPCRPAPSRPGCWSVLRRWPGAPTATPTRTSSSTATICRAMRSGPARATPSTRCRARRLRRS